MTETMVIALSPKFKNHGVKQATKQATYETRCEASAGLSELVNEGTQMMMISKVLSMHASSSRCERETNHESEQEPSSKSRVTAY